MENITAANNAADLALTDMVRAESRANGLARAITDLFVIDLPVPPLMRESYQEACAAVAAAQDAYLAATDEIDRVA